VVDEQRAGRAGPWIALSVVLWMVNSSVLCVLCKCMLLGRMKPRDLPLWSPRFACWMMVERLFILWEYLVGRFLLEPPWLVLMYKLLGANVAWSAHLDNLFRSWDLVTVGPAAHDPGLLHPRVFDRYGVRFCPILVSCGSGVRPAAVWCRGQQPSAKTGGGGRGSGPSSQRALSQRHALVRQPCATRQGQRSLLAAASAACFITRAALPFVFLACSVGGFFVSNAAVGSVQSLSEAWTRDAWLLGPSYVVSLSITGLQLLALVVLLKWSFLSPFLTDALAGLTISTYSPLLVNTWHRLLGMQVGPCAFLLYSWACPLPQRTSAPSEATPSSSAPSSRPAPPPPSGRGSPAGAKHPGPKNETSSSGTTSGCAHRAGSRECASPTVHSSQPFPAFRRERGCQQGGSWPGTLQSRSIRHTRTGRRHGTAVARERTRQWRC
jgi:hypothetical protein